ncbi:MAG: hypothetical protein ACPGLV_15020 [Bacteroidia bacterium]
MRLQIMMFVIVISLSMQEYKSCDDLNDELNSKSTYCEKLDYFEKNGSFRCFKNFIYEVADTTGHFPTLYLGTLGAYYQNDSIKKKDVEVWKSFFDCN